MPVTTSPEGLNVSHPLLESIGNILMCIYPPMANTYILTWSLKLILKQLKILKKYYVIYRVGLYYLKSYGNKFNILNSMIVTQKLKLRRICQDKYGNRIEQKESNSEADGKRIKE